MANSNQYFEGCGHEGPIKCIFLSEFHDTAGSKITCQVKIDKIDRFLHNLLKTIFSRSDSRRVCVKGSFRCGQCLYYSKTTITRMCSDSVNKLFIFSSLLLADVQFVIDAFSLYRNALGYKIVGHPVRIENQRYIRNAFYFNLCFVCDSWARTIQYEPIVKKLSEYFVSSTKQHIA